jgi:hypothetical protein
MAKKRYYDGKSKMGSSYHWTMDASNEILPREVKYEQYPKCEYINENNMYDDSIEGIDMQKNDTIRGINRNPSKIKY